MRRVWVSSSSKMLWNETKTWPPARSHSVLCCFDPPWPNAIRPEAHGLPDISGQPLVPSSCLKKKRCFYLVETKCTVDVCAAPCGSWGMSPLFSSKDMQTVQYKRSGSWNGKFPRSLVCSCMWPLLLGGRGVFIVSVRHSQSFSLTTCVSAYSCCRFCSLQWGQKRFNDPTLVAMLAHLLEITC